MKWGMKNMAFIVKQQVRELNKKAFADDMIYTDEDASATFKEIISKLIMNYDAKDALAALPTIVEIKDSGFDQGIVELVKLLSTDAIYIQVNNKSLDDISRRELIEEIQRIGYKIVIEINEDDSVFTLVQAIADIVKFDIHHIPKALIEKNVKFKCKKLAYGVDTAEDYALAESSGVELYEGTYISDTQELKIEAMKHSHINFIEVLSIIHNDNADIKDIAKVIERDSIISSQVIRLSNSAYFSTSTNRIESVSDAIVRIGLKNLKNWLFMLEFSRKGSASEEVLQASYQRALFCRDIYAASKVSKSGRANKSTSVDDAYLIGLFSMLDVLSKQPLETLIASMNLKDEVKDALLYREGIGGTLLNCAKAYAEADWKRVGRYVKDLGIKQDKLTDIYMESLESVRKIWSNMTSKGDIIN